MEIFVFLVILVVVVGIISAHYDNKKNEKRRSDLIARYGKEMGELIADGKICVGMGAYHLRESWGEPAAIDETVLKTKTKQVWKYGRYGANRYSQRVFLEDGIVVGWQGPGGKFSVRA